MIAGSNAARLILKLRSDCDNRASKVDVFTSKENLNGATNEATTKTRTIELWSCLSWMCKRSEKCMAEFLVATFCPSLFLIELSPGMCTWTELDLGSWCFMDLILTWSDFFSKKINMIFFFIFYVGDFRLTWSFTWSAFCRLPWSDLFFFFLSWSYGYVIWTWYFLWVWQWYTSLAATISCTNLKMVKWWFDLHADCFAEVDCWRCSAWWSRHGRRGIENPGMQLNWARGSDIENRNRNVSYHIRTQLKQLDEGIAATSGAEREELISLKNQLLSLVALGESSSENSHQAGCSSHEHPPNDVEPHLELEPGTKCNAPFRSGHHTSYQNAIVTDVIPAQDGEVGNVHVWRQRLWDRYFLLTFLLLKAESRKRLLWLFASLPSRPGCYSFTPRVSRWNPASSFWRGGASLRTSVANLMAILFPWLSLGNTCKLRSRFVFLQFCDITEPRFAFRVCN